LHLHLFSRENPGGRVVAASDGDTIFVYEGYYNEIVTPLYLYIQHILSKSKSSNHKQDKEAKEGDVKNY